MPADELDPVCLMLSKDALAAAGGLPAHESLAQSVMRLGRELKQRGYSLWHALEVFVYSRPLEPVVRAGATPPQAYAETPPPLLSAEDLLDQACALKRDRRYAEAIDLLLQARAAIADGPGGGMAPQYGMSGGASGRAVQFIDQARACKQQRNYQQAIMLLNEARNIPGLCAGL